MRVWWLPKVGWDIVKIKVVKYIVTENDLTLVVGTECNKSTDHVS